MTSTTPTEELRAGRTVIVHTVGVSMQPLLTEGVTLVRIRPLAQEAVPNRAILLYVRDNGQVVLHRLIRQNETTLYMRGDNTYGLEPIRREQALGIATDIFRGDACIHVDTDRRYRAYVTRRLLHYPWRYFLLKVRRLPGAVRRRLTGGGQHER